MDRLSLCWFAAFLLASLASVCTASWGTPDSANYHIQTDEGPERYFKYQTDNGQYRKERRLEDGTVIGTEAWIDASGYMRQKDYIADSKGYRILKSKTVFVGKDRPIQEAIKAAKKAPATAGTLVHNDSPNTAQRNYIPPRRGGSYEYSSTTRLTSINPNPLGYDHYSPNDLVPPRVKPLAVYLPGNQRTPIAVASRHEDEPVHVTPRNNYSRPSVSLAHHDSAPSLILEAPFPSDTPVQHNHLPEPIAVYESQSVTPIPNYETTTTARPFVVSSIRPNAVEHINNHVDTATYPPLRATTYRPKLTYEPADGVEYTTKDSVRPLFDRNALRRRVYEQQQPLVSNNALGNGYDPQYPYYDGVSETADGFRYYLPRQYHEEDNTNPERRAGSFGYIDPFGIRRVVYYNTSPEGGFVHRKNNRYVGFNATPYDPRPL